MTPAPRSPELSRRRALLAGLGLSASFMAGGEAFAATGAAKRKLVIIVLRGAMDGLSAAPPIGDRDYYGLRSSIAIAADQALKLDSDFGLHPKLANFHGLTQAGEARIAPAVAIPQRIRSHFEAQDLLETGGDRLYGATTGWLNRTLSAVQPNRPIKALSIGAQEPLILRGPIQAQSWSPGGKVTPNISRVATMLQDLYKGDPLLGEALATGLQTEATADSLNGGQPMTAKDVRGFAVTAAKFMVADGGPQIAVLSLDGFDTHANQGGVDGQLATRLKGLDEVFAGLREGLGPAWKETVVVAVTEFGRTARQNGTGGTDHGTAGTLLMAGGALKPQHGIVGDWPTLAQARLFENRDLAPTLDVRSVFKGVLAEHLGVDGRALDGAVFPNSASAQPVRGLVA